MKIKILAYIFAISVVVSACKTTEKNTKEVEVVNLPELEIKPSNEGYHGSRTRYHDLINTSLNLRFDWEKKHVLGEATITSRPYFYSTDSIQLDAKGFDIHEISLVKNNSRTPLKYEYADNKLLNIKLDKVYSRDEKFILFIKYTAKPDELPVGGSMAITSDKGLYFINADGSDPDKPKQIWTQGETEANSKWFPTFDSPNERMSQEIFLTVDTVYETLSNGALISSKVNNDGTRTDHWKQELPHAPYLFMLGMGDYAIVKDTWKGKPVQYYVEHKYEPYAREIFNNTPEMLTHFSQILNYDYPWDKYNQIVVRDYVSGAMENTGAVIFGEFVQLTDREILDQNYEDIVAHELFHHWFGDLVTCESWANIPLNEAFATYGEYIWSEYKHGRDAADHAANDMLNQYLQEAQIKKVELIRYHYEDKEDMFDSHSYQKGGRVLHMLRKTVGDSAFYKALNVYLEKNKFQAVEIHNLRLAFEEVTGQDLNWFFNQWFLSSGHPELEIKYGYNEVDKTATINVKQNQDLANTPLYKLPVAVDVYVNGNKTRHDIVVDKKEQTFSINVSSMPDLINFDAEKMLLAVKKENKTIDQYIYQYKNAGLYIDKLEALKEIGDNYELNTPSAELVLKALNDKYWHIRQTAIKNTDALAKQNDENTKQKLLSLAKNDPKSSVRAAALKQLAKYYKEENLKSVYKEALNDRSYAVIAAALNSMVKLDKTEGMLMAQKFQDEENATILNALAGIYAETGDAEYNNFYLRALEKLNGFEKYNTIQSYSKYLSNSSDVILDRGILVLEKIARTDDPWWIRLAAYQGLENLTEHLNEKSDTARLQNLDKLLTNIKLEEKEPMLVKIYKNMN